MRAGGFVGIVFDVDVGVAFIGLRCGGWGERNLQPSIGVYRDPADLLANVGAWIRGSRDRHVM